ncbi:hypothetical protein DERF_014855 [Dermatophagoides farinae]|uniref:Uncharacterized protein n=1 Tax=Dermatophagoides farinae TaxID=6954 RepID=A0A922KZM3_DERFA|nr:hypothetical protein DERF_014855 [Dermatophagoides farinae]
MTVPKSGISPMHTGLSNNPVDVRSFACKNTISFGLS